MEYYRILGLSRDASPEEIREAYFAAARSLHPDVNLDPGAKDQFLSAHEAYEVLSDPVRRSDYDHSLPPAPPDPQLQTNFFWSRKTLKPSAEAQLVYALLEISTAAQPDKSKIPSAHISLVIDRSTSMQGERMDMVKASVLKLIRNLKPQDWISVVVFSDRAEVLIPPTRAAEVKKFEGRISLIRTGGSTELARGLEAGLEQLNLIRGIKTKRQLMLLTDGHTYGDEPKCLALSERATQGGVTIHALGLGHEWNDAFLDELSSKTGGNAIFIKSDRELQEFFNAKINSINLLFAEGLRLDLTLSPEVDLLYSFRIEPESNPLGNRSNLILGDLLYNNRLRVLFEFKVKRAPEEVKELELFRGKLWLDLARGIETRSRILVRANMAVASGFDSEIPPANVVEAMSQITMYRLQEKARKEVAEGKIESATRHLQYLATNLLSQGDRTLAHEVLVEAENIRQSHSFSKDGDKRIKYATRALFLPSGLEPK